MYTTGEPPERIVRHIESGGVQMCPQLECLRGRDGRDGRDGGKGEKGEVGPRGEKGDRGEVGPQGTKGNPGPQGPVGMSGPQGAVGEKGDRGDPGLPGPQGAQGPLTGGAVYTHWGRTSCPSGQGTELLYSGRAGGTRWDHKGGAANILCLPNDPQYSQYRSGVDGHSPLTGVEYRVVRGEPLHNVDLHKMPCAVCYISSRVTVLMIPAKLTCPTNWTTEYTGYMMTSYYNHNAKYLYECIDQATESVPGLNSHDDNNAYFWHIEATCNSLSCPPYDAGKEVTCVVCTR